MALGARLGRDGDSGRRRSSSELPAPCNAGPGSVFGHGSAIRRQSEIAQRPDQAKGVRYPVRTVQTHNESGRPAFGSTEAEQAPFRAGGSLAVTRKASTMPLSEHDEAQKADAEDLAAKIAKDLRDLRDSWSSLSHVPAGMSEEELTIRWTRPPCTASSMPAGPCTTRCAGFSAFRRPIEVLDVLDQISRCPEFDALAARPGF